MSSPYQIINPEALGAPRGFSNGMLAPRNGQVLFAAGQTGTNAAGRIVDPDFVAQFRTALARSVAIVEKAGGRVEDIGRLTIYVTDMDGYRNRLSEIGAVYREIMGRHFPTMALVAISELVDPEAKVEIEATAVVVVDSPKPSEASASQ